jgi:uncharacterized damage-inducible protein DinB
VSAAFGALAAVLDDLAAVVVGLDTVEYADSGIAGLSGSVGSHVRHVLDHVRAFETGIASGLVDYEARVRDTALEQDGGLALAALGSARRRLGERSDAVRSRAVVVRTRLEAGLGTTEFTSTVGRELAFVLSHTIHHSAVIALLLHRIAPRPGLPARFGLAPGTPALVVAVRCAR